MSGMWRSKNRAESAAWQHLYKRKRWLDLRERQLTLEPLCRFCLATEEVTAAEVVDHIKQHKGDEALFFDPDNLQSLCRHHHDSAKQAMERGRKVFAYGADGYPIELG